MTIVGDTDAERDRLRNFARFQIAFYGSTRSYAGVFDIHGWEGLADRLHQLQRAGDTVGMAAAITDDMLDTYAITSTWDELADRLIDRYDGVADRLVMYSLGNSYRHDPSVIERWASVTHDFHRKTI
jgi:alkanesulfonate monooxygenase SsuD/methylene tetrahydromethanopterin reductase-like flavin-dependent oxidoreductase (luciferase family)